MFTSESFQTLTPLTHVRTFDLVCFADVGKFDFGAWENVHFIQ